MPLTFKFDLGIFHIFLESMRAPMICLYAQLQTKGLCIFTETQLASGVQVMRTSWNIFYFHSPHLAHVYLSPACITRKLGLLPCRGIRAKPAQTASAGDISAAVWG